MLEKNYKIYVNIDNKTFFVHHTPSMENIHTLQFAHTGTKNELQKPP